MSVRISLRRAFTLIELLLVLAIIGIVTAIVVPNFVTSLRGSRLRAGVRTVVKVGRYARSMAVLRQSPVKVKFDLAGGVISVVDGGSDNISRALDRVKIHYVEIQDEKTEEGQVVVEYRTNGRCIPYSVVIMDEEGAFVKINIDALAVPEIMDKNEE